MITIKLVSNSAELAGIQQLQQKNLKRNLAVEEYESEGFVTAEYSLEFLEKMHKASPSVIAKDGNTVIAYALVATKIIRHEHDLLADLFSTIDTKIYKGKSLQNSSYVVVGQLCVDKAYRGIGLVKSMYNFFKEQLKNTYDYCITDVAADNPRSLKAHIKTGFQVIDTLTYGGISWDIVLWDWTI